MWYDDGGVFPSLWVCMYVRCYVAWSGPYHPQTPLFNRSIVRPFAATTISPPDLFNQPPQKHRKEKNGQIQVVKIQPE
ncbi:unnamed protein product [Periconia digitata]|uniref:Uncharacterized protein n=1 Tax=Periconia digitata TaxID=1303443 RepID=A0A9W4U8H3_9PLEO|nr:unnamed protein product [Periconia digitata]